VNVQRGIVLDNLNDIEKFSKKLIEDTKTEWFVVKAQIHAGGRGKGGGVKLAKKSR
jgi:succinyl-CoA synthetase beta subunit